MTRKIGNRYIVRTYGEYAGLLIISIVGYKITIEQSTPDGSGRVDVSFERDGEKNIACEISVTSTDEQELGNIEKCLNAGYEKVILCSAEKRTLEKIKALVSQRLSENDQSKVYNGPRKLDRQKG